MSSWLSQTSSTLSACFLVEVCSCGAAARHAIAGCVILHLQAEKTTRKAQLADRLVNGLSGENKRWSETIKKIEVAGGKLVRDLGHFQ
jgi:hypothetical protein